MWVAEVTTTGGASASLVLLLGSSVFVSRGPWLLRSWPNSCSRHRNGTGPRKTDVAVYSESCEYSISGKPYRGRIWVDISMKIGHGSVIYLAGTLCRILGFCSVGRIWSILYRRAQGCCRTM